MTTAKYAKCCLKWVMPAYSEFLHQVESAERLMGGTLDGDIHVFHYRKSHFANPDLQNKLLCPFPKGIAAAKDLA